MFEIRTCISCKKEKVLEEFRKVNDRKSGRSRTCKECHNIYCRLLNNETRKKKVISDDGFKTCKFCDKSKDMTNFHKNPITKDGRTNYCRECSTVLAFQRRIKKDYGMTIEDYNDFFEIQDGRCAICNKHQSELDKRLYIDHNHVTGEVRGLLCANCNTLLGMAQDRINILEAAINYIEESVI